MPSGCSHIRGATLCPLRTVPFDLGLDGRVQEWSASSGARPQQSSRGDGHRCRGPGQAVQRNRHRGIDSEQYRGSTGSLRRRAGPAPMGHIHLLHRKLDGGDRHLVPDLPAVWFGRCHRAHRRVLQPAGPATARTGHLPRTGVGWPQALRLLSHRHRSSRADPSSPVDDGRSHHGQPAALVPPGRHPLRPVGSSDQPGAGHDRGTRQGARVQRGPGPVRIGRDHHRAAARWRYLCTGRIDLGLPVRRPGLHDRRPVGRSHLEARTDQGAATGAVPPGHRRHPRQYRDEGRLHLQRLVLHRRWLRRHSSSHRQLHRHQCHVPVRAPDGQHPRRPGPRLGHGEDPRSHRMGTHAAHLLLRVRPQFAGDLPGPSPARQCHLHPGGDSPDPRPRRLHHQHEHHHPWLHRPDVRSGRIAQLGIDGLRPDPRHLRPGWPRGDRLRSRRAVGRLGSWGDRCDRHGDALD